MVVGVRRELEKAFTTKNESHLLFTQVGSTWVRTVLYVSFTLIVI